MTHTDVGLRIIQALIWYCYNTPWVEIMQTVYDRPDADEDDLYLSEKMDLLQERGPLYWISELSEEPRSRLVAAIIDRYRLTLGLDD